MGRMAEPLRGFTHVSLSVRDMKESLAFYRDGLGLEVLRDIYAGTVFEGREAMLLVGRMALCLQEHARNDGTAFEPTRTGLDHFAFFVPSEDDLQAWADQLTARGIEHSGVKPLPGYGHFIELRDPDGIQLELHCLS